MYLRKVTELDLLDFYEAYYSPNRGEFAPDDFTDFKTFETEFLNTGFFKDDFKTYLAIEDNVMVGCGFLFNSEYGLELGTFVFSTLSKGTGTKITKLLIEEAPTKEVWCTPKLLNSPSCRMVEKCGFIRKDTVQDYALYRIVKGQ